MGIDWPWNSSIKGIPMGFKWENYMIKYGEIMGTSGKIEVSCDLIPIWKGKHRYSIGNVLYQTTSTKGSRRTFKWELHGAKYLLLKDLSNLQRGKRENHIGQISEGTSFLIACQRNISDAVWRCRLGFYTVAGL